MDTKMKDQLVIAAFNQAYSKEHPESGLIVHTDQGSQFTSGNFQMLMKSKKAIHSESRKGNPYDNALMESFYRTIKRELIRDAHYGTPEESQKKSLNILNYTIILNGCTLHSTTFLLSNLKKIISIILLTLCPQNLEMTKRTASLLCPIFWVHIINAEFSIYN